MTEPRRGTLAVPGEQALAREKLRRRILEIVDRKSSLSDITIWRESAPDYLPWKDLAQEIRELDKDQKLRLEIVEPGNWMIHSLATPPPAAAKPAAKAAKKAKANKTAKRSRAATKKSGA